MSKLHEKSGDYSYLDEINQFKAMLQNRDTGGIRTVILPIANFYMA